MSKIRHEFIREFCSSATDNHTKKTYLEGIDRFCSFLKSEGISEREALRMAKANDTTLPQQYYDWMINEKQYRPTSAHTYLTGITKLFHISMDQIEKLPRISSQTVKGRTAEKNLRGKADANKDRYQRIVKFASGVGIRRAEYAQLYGRDIRYNASGEPVGVFVRSGKGGKSTTQFILPSHREEVFEVVKGVMPDEKIFSREEMSLRTDLHGYRRDIARESYEYFRSLSSESRDRLRDGLIKTFSENKKGVTPSQISRFTREVAENRPYRLRGGNREKAIKEGRKTSLDRLSLYATSIYCLSHWRLDVTMSYLQ